MSNACASDSDSDAETEALVVQVLACVAPPLREGVCELLRSSALAADLADEVTFQLRSRVYVDRASVRAQPLIRPSANATIALVRFGLDPSSYDRLLTVFRPAFERRQHPEAAARGPGARHRGPPARHVTAEKALEVLLLRLRTPDSQTSLQWATGLQAQEISNALALTRPALLDALRAHPASRIRYPSRAKQKAMLRAARHVFPATGGIVFLVDGTAQAVSAAPYHVDQDPDAVDPYYNMHYMSAVSISVILLDVTGRVVDASVAHPGNTNDITIFREMLNRHSQCLAPGALIGGDRGFLGAPKIRIPALRFTPAYDEPENRAFVRLRQRVENFFASLRTLFPFLHRMLPVHEQTTADWIELCLLLYNWRHYYYGGLQLHTMAVRDGLALPLAQGGMIFNGEPGYQARVVEISASLNGILAERERAELEDGDLARRAVELVRQRSARRIAVTPDRRDRWNLRPFRCDAPHAATIAQASEAPPRAASASSSSVRVGLEGTAALIIGLATRCACDAGRAVEGLGELGEVAGADVVKVDDDEAVDNRSHTRRAHSDWRGERWRRCRGCAHGTHAQTRRHALAACRGT